MNFLILAQQAFPVWALLGLAVVGGYLFLNNRKESSDEETTTSKTVETETKVVQTGDHTDLNAIVDVQDLSALINLISKASKNEKLDVSITIGRWQYTIKAEQLPEGTI